MGPDRSTVQNIILRSALLDDARFLFECRNDPETRANSVQIEPVAWNDHVIWLEASLKNTNRKLFIAESDGGMVGTGRGDRIASGWELSWTVAPGNRGQGIGRALVMTLMVELDGPLIARVRANNAASLHIAEACGLARTGTDDGFIIYTRP